MRGDASREMKQTVIETLCQNQAHPGPNLKPIFKDISAQNLTLSKLVK